MTDETLASVEDRLARNLSIGQALFALGMSSQCNADSMRELGLDDIAEASDKLAEVVAGRILELAAECAELQERGAAAKAEASALEGLLTD